MTESSPTKVHHTERVRLWVRCQTQAACLLSSFLVGITKKRLLVDAEEPGVWKISLNLERKQITKRFLSRLHDLCTKLGPHLGQISLGWEASLGEAKNLRGERRFFREFKVTDRLIVAPWGVRRSDPNESLRILELEPGVGFPCGIEPWSRSMLIVADQLLREQAIHQALDVRTGCGLLALSTLLWGVGRVTALDTDPQAVRTTRLNATKNGLRGRLKARCTDVRRIGGKFDLVMAMASHNFIMRRAGHLSSLVLPSGWLLLGGFWHKWAEVILLEFQRQFQLVHRRKELWWETLLLRQRN